MNPIRKASRRISMLVNKITGGTVQNENRGGAPGQAFPGMAEAARAAAADGAVLLKNDGALPLEQGARVALFGRVQTDWFYVGYGSGGDVRAPYLVSPVEGLKSAGIIPDERLLSLYSEWVKRNPADHGFWGHWPHSHPEMPVSDSEIALAANRAETAVVFIGRAAGEDRDAKLARGSYYLTAEEEHLLTRVALAFRKTAVVLDIGSTMDFSWCERIPVSAVLVVWQGGMESGNALGDLLAGKKEPGGRLTDTIARDYHDYPSARDFGGKKFNFYTEDIYVGYRYFETFAPEKVLFPFGGGKGYTDFEISAVSVTENGGKAEVAAQVRNTGNRTGREVVQLYLKAPATRLPRPAKVLAAFAKTPPVAAGESVRVTLRFDVSDFAAYDDKTCERVTEKGEYRLYLGKNVRDAAFVGSFSVGEERAEKLQSCAAPVFPFKRLTQKDGKAAYEDAPLSEVDLKTRIASALPDAFPAPADTVTFADVKAGRRTAEELAATFSVEELEAVSRGDYTMNSPLGARGNAGVLCGVTESLRAKGLPALTTTDGPSGIRLAESCSLLPSGICIASSWDTESTEKLYALLGEEMRAKGSHILLAPGMNIHRNPLCGRNFEYFSEDPLLTGKTAAAVIRGIQSAGLSACPKHFACNNQERRRIFNDSRLSERALREIYLEGFRIAVTEGRPHCIMTSYNKINGVWGHYHYDLCTTVLRGEWGFKGAVMTDWWMRYAASPEFPSLRDNAYRVRAQVDILMPGGKRVGGRRPDGTLTETLGKDGGIRQGELQRTAANVIRMAASFTLPQEEK